MQGPHARVEGLLVPLDAHQLAQLPFFELGRGVEAICVVHIGERLLSFLCKSEEGCQWGLPDDG